MNNNGKIIVETKSGETVTATEFDNGYAQGIKIRIGDKLLCTVEVADNGEAKLLTYPDVSKADDIKPLVLDVTAYELEFTVSSDENEHFEPYTQRVYGKDVTKLKNGFNEFIVRAVKANEGKTGKYLVEYTINKFDEYFESDSAVFLVDVRNETATFEVEAN